MAMAALDAGLHVMCEKPLALNARQAKEMVKKAEAIGVVHMVCFTWRVVPFFQHFGSLIDDGYIGRCFHCHIRWLARYDYQGRYNWRFDRNRAHGILGDLGSHMIDLARWCVGHIAKVSAHLGFYAD